MKQFCRIKNRLISTQSIVQGIPPDEGGVGQFKLTDGSLVELTLAEWISFEALIKEECDRLDRIPGMD